MYDIPPEIIIKKLKLNNLSKRENLNTLFRQMGRHRRRKNKYKKIFLKSFFSFPKFNNKSGGKNTPSPLPWNRAETAGTKTG